MKSDERVQGVTIAEVLDRLLQSVDIRGTKTVRNPPPFPPSNSPKLLLQSVASEVETVASAPRFSQLLRQESSRIFEWR